MTTKTKGRVSDVVASSAFTDIHVLRPRFGEGLGWPALAGAHNRKLIDPQGKFAMDCIERWALVAAEPDGEDSAGRAKLRRMTPEEVVQHACECASKAFAAFEERGWLIAVPAMADLVDAVKDYENGND